MALLTGRFKNSFSSGQSLRLPKNYAEKISTDALLQAEPFGLVLSPRSNGFLVAFLPWELRKETIIAQLNEIEWSSNVISFVRNYRIHKCSPLYESHRLSHAVVEADLIVQSELKRYSKSLLSMSGRKFERFIRDVLKAFKIEVQANVFVKGAEIDLVLCEEKGKFGKEHTIIECKNWLKSGDKVGISQVLRAIGLADVIKDNLFVKNNLILTTTDFSIPARQIAKYHNVDLIRYEEFSRW